MMKNTFRNLNSSAISLLLLLAVGGCRDRPRETAQQEHERQDAELAKMVEDQVPTDPQNPFGPAQTLAEDSMGAAVGQNLDQTWVRMMVEHQEGAVRFADIVLRTKPPVTIARSAEKIKHDAHARIVVLNSRREASFLTDGGARDAFAPVISETFGRLTQSAGETIGHTWVLKMIAYDRGGVALAGIEATQGRDQRIKALAKELAASLADEADALERLTPSQRSVSRPSSRYVSQLLSEQIIPLLP